MLYFVERMPPCLGPQDVQSRLAMDDSIFRKTNESSSGLEEGRNTVPKVVLCSNECKSGRCRVLSWVVWECAEPGSISNTGIVIRGKQTLPTKSVGEGI